MSEVPFWDDVCLRGSIDQAPLPAPPRSLFDADLFCEEPDVDNFADMLPPLPSSPVLPTLSRPLHPSSPQPQAPPFDPSQAVLPSSQGQSLFPSLMPLCTTLPSAIAAPLTSSLTHQSPSTRPWRSFLDDNCPLRKRVKVTIVPTSRKHERDLSSSRPPPAAEASPPLKKPRHSQSRVTAPRRLQTTFRVPKPGDSSARLTLHVPSTGQRIRPRSLTKQRKPKSTCTFSPFNIPSSVPYNSVHKAKLDTVVAKLDFFEQDEQQPCTKTVPSASLANVTHTYPCSSPPAPPPSPPRPSRPTKDSADSAIITASLSARLSSMVGKHRSSSRQSSTRPFSTLPLVDVAVQAVSFAARAYHETLASVALPVAAVASSMKRHPPISRNSKKRSKTRRRRTLLSFDDQDVKPLYEDDVSAREGALARYLNAASPCEKRVKAC